MSRPGKEDIGGWVRDGTEERGDHLHLRHGGGDLSRHPHQNQERARHHLPSTGATPRPANGWLDESDTTMKLTQARIERVLGMDCNTFCSVALIRQDAYGLFLEASSDRRMEVLSALLGLDIYGRLEDLAKDGASEQRRKIAATRERLSVLEEQIAAKRTELRS